MAIEDTFGYRFVRISLVLLNCLVLVRLVSLLLQYSHVFEPTFVLFILLIGSNFLAAIIGAIREHRISVLITGSLTLIMFLSLLFTNKENKNINVSLFTLLAIAAQSLIFSEMLKERQIFSQRQNLEIFGPVNSNAATTAAAGSADATRRTTHAGLDQLSTHPHYFVVYQPPESNRRVRQSGGIFMVDPLSPKDPPPSYFSASCPPPKYEDAIKLNQPAAMIVPTLSGASNSTTTNSDSNQQNQQQDQDQSSTTTTTTNTSQNNTPTCSRINNDNEINNNNNNSSSSSDNTPTNDNNNCAETSITIDDNNDSNNNE